MTSKNSSPATPDEWLLADFERRRQYGPRGATVRPIMAFQSLNDAGQPYRWRPGVPSIYDPYCTDVEYQAIYPGYCQTA